MEYEKRIRKLIGIDDKIRLYAIETYKKKGKTFYRFTGWDTQRKKMVKIHIPRKLEGEILRLWDEHRKEKKREKELEREIKKLIKKYKNVEKIKEIFEKLLNEDLTKPATSYAIKNYTEKAKKIFEEYKSLLVKLYKEGVFKRLNVLQVLYFITNLKDLSETYENPQYFFNRGINTIVRVCKNEKIENPFGTLKNDFFLSGSKTPYDFLLSNFLHDLIGDTLLELLKSEYEKEKAVQEARMYKERMEKLKEIVEWFEKQSSEVKTLAKEIISPNILDVAEKFLKETQETKMSLKDIEHFLKNSAQKEIIEYFEYLGKI